MTSSDAQTKHEKPMSVVIAPKTDHDSERNDMTDMLDEIDVTLPYPNHDDHEDDKRDDFPDTSFDDGVSLWSSPLAAHKNIATMVVVGRRAISQANGIEKLKEKLMPYLHQLNDKTSFREYESNNTIRRVLLNEWIEELLRFLALKTVTEDLTEPFQLYPGYTITLAWKMMTSLPQYNKVCLDMGNLQLFEFEVCVFRIIF